MTRCPWCSGGIDSAGVLHHQITCPNHPGANAKFVPPFASSMPPEGSWTVEDCRKHGLQYCHICPEFGCCDNATPTGKILRRLEMALNRPDAEMKHLRSHVKRLQKASTQDLDDKRVIRAMVDPEGRFKDESLVWIVNWLRSHSRIQPPKKTERGWG